MSPSERKVATSTCSSGFPGPQHFDDTKNWLRQRCGEELFDFFSRASSRRRNRQAQAGAHRLCNRQPTGLEAGLTQPADDSSKSRSVIGNCPVLQQERCRSHTPAVSTLVPRLPVPKLRFGNTKLKLRFTNVQYLLLNPLPIDRLWNLTPIKRACSAKVSPIELLANALRGYAHRLANNPDSRLPTVALLAPLAARQTTIKHGA